MKDKLNINLMDDDLFQEDAISLELNSPEALLTESKVDAYRILEGTVIVYIVPVKGGPSKYLRAWRR